MEGKNELEWDLAPGSERKSYVKLIPKAMKEKRASSIKQTSKKERNSVHSELYRHCSAGTLTHEIMASLYERGVEVSKPHSFYNSYTALHKAACSGHVEIIRLLLEYGANINATNNPKFTPLDIACAERRIGSVKELLAWKAPVNVQHYHGTPLYHAAYNCSPTIVSLLLEAKADVTTRCGFDRDTAFLAACNPKLRSKIHPERDPELFEQLETAMVHILTQLLAAGADVNEVSGRDGQSALHRLVYDDYSKCIEFLLQKNCDISAASDNEKKQNVFHYAIERNSRKCFKLLIDAAIQTGNTHLFDANDWEENSPLIAAASTHRGSSSASTFFLDALLEAKADINIVTDDGYERSLLEIAMCSFNTDAVKYLLDAKKDWNGVSAVCCAARLYSSDSLKLLLKAGYPVNDDNNMNSENPTALAGAIYRARVENVRILVDAKANVNALGSNKGSSFPLAYCNFSSNTSDLAQVLKILLEAKADLNVIPNLGLRLLRIAIENGASEFVHVLVPYVVPQHTQNIDGWTVGGMTFLFQHVICGYMDCKEKDTLIIHTLMNVGASLHTKDKYGTTLIQAVQTLSMKNRGCKSCRLVVEKLSQN